jgi:hypothetical protein
MLCVIDEFTREALAILVKRRLNAMDELEVLGDLIIVRGAPAFIRSDNGPEFVAAIACAIFSGLWPPGGPTIIKAGQVLVESRGWFSAEINTAISFAERSSVNFKTDSQDSLIGARNCAGRAAILGSNCPVVSVRCRSISTRADSTSPAAIAA